ncbi:MAG: helix-turn-helix transcriptional regulator [Selenomonas ruminantium]|nr:helix-turn-helix transcriptional regulator [Selenomonas ruminantium]
MLEKNFINTQIKALRKAKKLNQAEFGECIGLKTSAVSKMEQEGSTVTEQNIQMICQRFNVRRAWLVDGEGEMFDSPENSLFASFAKEYKLTPAEQNAARFLLTLSSEERQQMLKYVTMLADAINVGAQDAAKIDAEVEAYRQELEAEQAAPKGKLHRSEDTDGIIA